MLKNYNVSDNWSDFSLRRRDVEGSVFKDPCPQVLQLRRIPESVSRFNYIPCGTPFLYTLTFCTPKLIDFYQKLILSLIFFLANNEVIRVFYIWLDSLKAVV